MNKLWLCFLLISAASGCANAAHHTTSQPDHLQEHRVLVIVNDNSIASQKIGAYYAQKRHIPPGFICHIRCPEQEEVNEDVFSEAILGPVADKLALLMHPHTVDYLVLTKGVPLRIHSDTPSADPRMTPNGDSVDGRLMTQDLLGMSSPNVNPFFNSKVRFTHAKFGLYLATRLDGYTVKDAESLVDRALIAKPSDGVFVLDGAPSRKGGPGEPHLNDYLDTAAQILRSRHKKVLLDQTLTFLGGIANVMGYWSWGSNDPAFTTTLYLGNTFRAGALAETAVSTSARTMLPTSGGQSLIADLVAHGITGVKGYVAEPYSFSMAHADILFDRYTKGWNLAESFYSASYTVHWKDVVLGDPLCAPYAK